MMGKRHGAAQIATASPTGCADSNRHKNLLFSQLARSLARSLVQQAKHDPEAIFELRWSAQIPLARPGGAGHDGKTSWYGSNRNGVAGSLRSQQSTQKPALFATRSLAVYYEFAVGNYTAYSGNSNGARVAVWNTIEV
jgi:hypothetical protein